MAADNRQLAQARRENRAQSEAQEDEVSTGIFYSFCFLLSTDIFEPLLVMKRPALQQAGIRLTHLHPPVANPSHHILGSMPSDYSSSLPTLRQSSTSSLSKLYHGSLRVAFVSLLHPKISNFDQLVSYGFFCMVSQFINIWHSYENIYSCSSIYLIPCL